MLINITKPMKNYLLLIILLVPSILSYSQDIIVKTDGQKIQCKVLDVDSANVYFILSSKDVKTYLLRTEVSEIFYDIPIPDYKGALTVGFLEGGGSLVGFDVERMISKKVGIQLGFGAIGFGFGLNMHFKPTVRSSFLSLQYWHQGFSNSYTQSLIGPSLVIRSNKLFTCQLGLGYALEKGPAWPENRTQPQVMLTYAIGFYIPSH